MERRNTAFSAKERGFKHVNVKLDVVGHKLAAAVGRDTARAKKNMANGAVAYSRVAAKDGVKAISVCSTVSLCAMAVRAFCRGGRKAHFLSREGDYRKGIGCQVQGHAANVMEPVCQKTQEGIGVAFSVVARLDKRILL